VFFCDIYFNQKHQIIYSNKGSLWSRYAVWLVYIFKGKKVLTDLSLFITVRLNSYYRNSLFEFAAYVYNISLDCIPSWSPSSFPITIDTYTYCEFVTNTSSQVVHQSADVYLADSFDLTCL